MSIKQQILAYLVDASGKIYETLVILRKDAQADVDAMNGTAHAYTNGNLQWTLEAPQSSQQLGLGDLS